MDARHEQNRVPGSVCGGLFLAGGLAVLAVGLAGVSCLKMLGEHPSRFSGQALSVSAPVIRFLREKTLWDLVPAFEPEHPLGVSSILFVLCAGVCIGMVRVMANQRLGETTGGSAAGATGRAWRIPFVCSGPVMNYSVTFNGPVTNPQVLQVTAAVELERITSDLEKFLQNVANDSQLPEEKKKDVCDLVHTIAEEAQRPERERKTAVVKAVIHAIPIVISTTKSLVELWTEIQPHLISFFS